jgi:hypothetical protein
MIDISSSIFAATVQSSNWNWLSQVISAELSGLHERKMNEEIEVKHQKQKESYSLTLPVVMLESD